MTRILVRDPARPFATTYVGFPIGSLHDPRGKAGLAHLATTLMTRGVSARDDEPALDRQELAEAIESLGSTLDAHVGRDALTMWSDGLTRHRAKTSRLMTRVLHDPTFSEDEIEKAKREILAEIDALVDDDASLGQRFFVRALFSDHAYGRPVKGTEDSLARISRDDLLRFHADVLASRERLLGGAGDIDNADLDHLADILFSNLSLSRDDDLRISAPPQIPGFRVVLVDKPERTQTQVFIGHLAPDALAPDFTALNVGLTVFGGTFTARLSQEIREKRGWSYGAYASLAGDRRVGSISMRFYPAEKDTVPALELCDRLYREFHADGPSDAELVAAQSYLQNSHVFTVDTAPRRLSELVSSALLGHPPDHVDTTVERLRQTTPEAVRAALRAHLRPDDVTVAIVCTAARLLPTLEAWGRATSIEVVDWKTRIADAP